MKKTNLFHKLPIVTTVALCGALMLTSCPGDEVDGAGSNDVEVELPPEVDEAQETIRKEAEAAAAEVTEDNADAALDELEQELSGDGK